MCDNQNRTAVSCGTILAALLVASSGVCLGGGIKTSTKPSKDATLSFLYPGKILKVLVKEGDEVKAAARLVQLDDAAERENLAYLKAQAEDKVRIEAAKAELEQRRLDFKKIEEAYRKRAATLSEWENAKLEEDIAELRLELQKFQIVQEGRKYREAKIRVDRMCLKSPIAGKVERLHVEAGECVDAVEQVIRIVKIDPLWIDASVPLQQATALKRGQGAEVEFPARGRSGAAAGLIAAGGGRTELLKGKIIHVGSVTVGIDKLMVRVEVPNPTGRPAGESVFVSFPPRSGKRSAGNGKAARPVAKVASREKRLVSTRGISNDGGASSNSN